MTETEEISSEQQPEPSRAEAFDIARQLIETLEPIEEHLGELRDHSLRNRKYIRFLFISVALDICLTVATVFFANLAVSSSDTANQAVSTLNQVTYNACVAQNASRLTQTHLWHKILSLIPPTSPQAIQFNQQVDHFVHQAFVQRNCNVYPHATP